MIYPIHDSSSSKKNIDYDPISALKYFSSKEIENNPYERLQKAHSTGYI